VSVNAPFRRWGKRRRLRSYFVALVDLVEWGEPERFGPIVPATSDGICPRCGSLIGKETSIQQARYGPPDARHEGWLHAWCPNQWQLLADALEDRDGLVVTKINHEGRRTAGCGHDVEGRPVYLVRQPVSLREPNHSTWMCEECVTP
jgi:hypothetical protein